MRITFVLARGVGLSGGQRTIAQWARHLQRRGHQVLLIWPPEPTPGLRERLRELRRDPFGAQHKRSHFDRLDVPRRVLERSRLVTAADVPDANVVIATWWETAEWVAAFPPRKGVHVHLVQGHEIMDYLPLARVEASYRLPFHHVVIAPWLQTLMRERYDDPDAQVISVGIDRAVFDAPPRGKSKIPTFGFTYSRMRFKGCDVILSAIALARAQLPRMRIVSFGLEKPSEKLLLPPGARFHFQPPQASLHTIYAQCDAWLYGSRIEGVGLPPMEAMACHTPVIGTAAGESGDLIPSGGILVPQEDPAAMATAMVRFAQMSEAEWRARADAVYAAVEPYTWERSTNQLEAALTTAMLAEKSI